MIRIASLIVFLISLSGQSALALDLVPAWSGTGGASDEYDVVLASGRVAYSSPSIADIDGNPADGLEIVAASQDGFIHATKSDGSLLWSATSPPSGCGGSRSRIYSSPAIADLNGDGLPEVLVGYGGFSKGCDGGIIVLSGQTGSTLWSFSTKANAKNFKYSERLYGVYTSPAVDDVDGDGKKEIGFGSFDRNIYLLNYDGSIRWFYNAADTVWSSPAFADIDGDGVKEMIAASDISQNLKIKPKTLNGGFVYALDTKPYAGKRHSFRSSKVVKWKRWLPQVVFSSPVIADVHPGNAGSEVMVMSGCFFPQGVKNKTGKWIKVLSARTGKVISTLPVSACSSASVAVGDVDDDGQLEIVAPVNGSRSIGGDGASKIYAFKANNPAPLWVATPKVRGKGYAWDGLLKQVALADLDNNGSLEVVTSTARGIAIINGRDGVALTCQTSSCDAAPMLDANATLLNSPAVADINGDGNLDVVAAGATNGGGAIYSWTGFGQGLGSTPGAQPPSSAPWPMFRGNASHTGRMD